jgi:hypothetical protein
MPIRAIERIIDGGGNEIGIRLVGVGKDGVLEVFYADIPGNSWNPQRLAKMVERVQQLIDVRIPLSDPSLVDDPAGPNGSDPALPNFFWDAGDLVARPIIISNVSWNGSRLNFTLTRAG